MMSLRLASFLALLQITQCLAWPKSGKCQCSSVIFQVSATANNFVFTDPPDQNNATDVIAFLSQTGGSGGGVPISGTQSINGTFTIHGVYCKPTRHLNKHPDSLQILVHGVTYNSTVWSGLGFGDCYNWHKFANHQGYHTLALDRLGYGRNDRSVDPLNVIQGPMHVEIIHQIITAIRNNAPNNALDRGFSKIAYIGHSFGSIIGTQLARLHPTDTVASIFTGWSTVLNPGPFQQVRFEPAAVHDPGRFAGVPFGYVMIAQEAQREAFSYGGAYDRTIPPVDFAFQDIVTDGELGSLLPFLSQPSVGYTSPVMVLTGVNDGVFCLPTQDGCDAVLTKSAEFFPNTTDFVFFAPPETGHVFNMHFSAQEAFKEAHKFLGRFL